MGDMLIKGADMDRTIASIVIKGDLSALTPEAKADYYRGLCGHLGLDPLTQPFSYLRLSGKEVLYANKMATDQLRVIHGVSIDELEERTGGGVYRIIAKGHDATGRKDASTGAVNIKGLEGEQLANAYMKAETKAKRRLTLSLCGLGMLDESEVRDIPDAEPVNVTPTKTAIAEPEPVEEPKTTPKPNGFDEVMALRSAIASVVRKPENKFSNDERDAAKRFCDEHRGDIQAMRDELARLEKLAGMVAK